MMVKLINNERPSDDEYRTQVAMRRRLEAAMTAHPGEAEYLPSDTNRAVLEALWRAQLNHSKACSGQVPTLPELPLW